MYPALSKRLAAIAQMVRPGRITADIGTDHGHLIVWLAATGRIPRGFACDVNPKPLEKAVRAAREAGVVQLVDCRLSDGLAALAGEPVEDIVIAGMGGELIARILEESPFSSREKKGQRYLLQPMTKPDLLRQWLGEQGYGLKGNGAWRREASAIPSSRPAGPGSAGRWTGSPPSPARWAAGRGMTAACIWSGSWPGWTSRPPGWRRRVWTPPPCGCWRTRLGRNWNNWRGTHDYCWRCV